MSDERSIPRFFDQAKPEQDTSEGTIEERIRAKGLTAPRLTPDDISNAIQQIAFHVFPGTQLTICCLTLKNGFYVVGHSALASPENYDAELGRDIAFKRAREQIWQLEGYLLKQQLYEESLA
jgi:hypothetical protein